MPLLNSIFNWRAPKGQAIKIAWSQETQHHLQIAKEKLKDAQPEETIKALSHLKNAGIDEQLSLLSIRLAQHQRDSRLGTLNSEQKDTAFNRIAKDLHDLTKAIEAQLAEGEKENHQLREAFRQRYRNRLTQKLASRQPVNLRRLASTVGTSERVADTFIPYNSEEIKAEISQTFQEAQGRLLIVGQPGAGKTTLLLQLADRLFDLEVDALPILINLATWQSSYGKLETWLEAVLAAELGTNKAGAKAVLRQSGLILLLDGLDELKEDEAINSCLAAIADYGATAGRRFVVTCRIEEYTRAAEDARVNLQIEVGPLTGEQLEAELTRMGREQPEAIPLLQAIQKDPLLRQAIETPFYFNTLQLLFAGRLPVFSAGDLEGRKMEIKEMFVAAALQNTQNQEYPPERARHWLAFLALRMNERNLVVFELRDLQYDWWRGWSIGNFMVSNFIDGSINMLLFGLALSVIFGLMDGLILGLADGLIFVLLSIIICGLISGLLYGLINGLRKNMVYIFTRDSVNWSVNASLRFIKKNLNIKLVFWLLLGIILSILTSSLYTDTRSPYGFDDGLVPIIVAIIMACWLLIMLIGGLIGGLTDMLESESFDFMQIKSPYQRFYASLKVLHFSILQHRHLRRLLYKKGALPLHLVTFLNEMSARHLLETDGASWRFRHRIIQDYFAGLWVEPEPKGQDKTEK